MNSRPRLHAFGRAALVGALFVPLMGCGGGSSAVDGGSDGGLDGLTELPSALSFELERPDPGTPIPEAEVQAFTRRLVGFWAKVDYFGWLRDVSYGVHPSTGKRDFMLWWTSVQDFVREGDTVVFGRLPDPPHHGGHNLMTRTSKVLAANIAGHLLTGDEAMARVAEGYCKGITSTMVGMVFDEDDPVDHLMARNVVPMDHAYTLDDGRRVEVDYATWRSPYDNWNCSRFRYADNPDWGEVWVTNMRSKDDVSRLLKAAVYVRYAVEQSPDEGVRAACSEALEHLKAFARDVVDHGYCIRTKGADGQVFCPGTDADPVPELRDERGDLADYDTWVDLIPESECKSRRAMALLGYGDARGNDCGRAADDAYEQMAITSHYFNIWIIRSTHLSAILQSLLNHDDQAARLLLEGLIERYEREVQTDPARYEQTQAVWDRDLATSLMQAAAVGYPVSWDEARMIQASLSQAIDETAEWPYWDPWAAGLADGRHPYRPPDADAGDPADPGDDRAWIRPEDMGTVLEICWSPVHNPAAVPFVDCDLVADPARWNPAWATP